MPLGVSESRVHVRISCNQAGIDKCTVLQLHKPTNQLDIRKQERQTEDTIRTKRLLAEGV